MKTCPNFRYIFVIACACLAGVLPIIASVTQGPQDGSQRRSTDPPAAAKGKLGQDLFLAIDHRDQGAVDNLLKRGADPNSRNGLYFTPLFVAAASHQLSAMQSLLNAGAEPDADSTYGNALMFAAATANVEGIELLVSKGGNVNNARSDGMTVLMMAANTGAPPAVAALLQHGANVNEKDYNDITALSYASRSGNAGAVQVLLANKAEVDAADIDGRTPLMMASMNGHADVVQMLLKAGANPNLRDKTGCTPLFLAAKYSDDAEVIKRLLAAGAKKSEKDNSGKTAAVVAAERMHASSASALGVKVNANAGIKRTSLEAAESGFKLLQSSMKTFGKKVGCVSCHQEGLGRMTMGEAKARGLKLDPELVQAQQAKLNGMLEALKPLHQGALKDPELMKQIPLIEINEVSTIDGWLLSGMVSNKQTPNEAIEAMTMVLAKQQAPQGFWSFSLPRTPMQSSFFTFTALSVRALQSLSPKSAASEIKERITRARLWLETAKPQTNEDLSSQLMGLQWSGSKSGPIKKCIVMLLKAQRPDGGWSQLPNLQSDAYATGQALYALHAAGYPSGTQAYQRGVQFLLRNQDSDGSWYVNKRAIPANNYMDGGFPHGISQYASFNGTCWAVMALLQAAK